VRPRTPLRMAFFLYHDVLLYLLQVLGVLAYLSTLSQNTLATENRRNVAGIPPGLETGHRFLTGRRREGRVGAG